MTQVDFPFAVDDRGRTADATGADARPRSRRAGAVHRARRARQPPDVRQRPACSLVHEPMHGRSGDRDAACSSRARCSSGSATLIEVERRRGAQPRTARLIVDVRYVVRAHRRAARPSASRGRPRERRRAATAPTTPGATACARWATRGAERHRLDRGAAVQARAARPLPLGPRPARPARRRRPSRAACGCRSHVPARYRADVLPDLAPRPAGRRRRRRPQRPQDSDAARSSSAPTRRATSRRTRCGSSRRRPARSRRPASTRCWPSCGVLVQGRLPEPTSTAATIATCAAGRAGRRRASTTWRKDYASFRRLMLDRLAQTMPGWRERNPADLGIDAGRAARLRRRPAQLPPGRGRDRGVPGHRAAAHVASAATRGWSTTAMHDGAQRARLDRARRDERLDGERRRAARGDAGAPRARRIRRTRRRAGSSDAVARRRRRVRDAATRSTARASRATRSTSTPGATRTAACRAARRAPRSSSAAPALGLARRATCWSSRRCAATTGLAVDADRDPPPRRPPHRATPSPHDRSADRRRRSSRSRWHADDALPFALPLDVHDDGGRAAVVRAATSCSPTTGCPSSDAPTSAGRPPPGPLGPAPARAHRPDARGAVPTRRAAVDAPGRRRALRPIRRGALPDDRGRGRGRDLEPRCATCSAATAFAAEFVVEIEDDGTRRAALRRRACSAAGPAGASVRARRYRVGSGAGRQRRRRGARRAARRRAGVTVRNPLPATGGTDRSRSRTSASHAPQAFRTQERAVTDADYAAAAERHPDVQRAAATRRWTGQWYTMFVTVDRRGGLPVDAAFEARAARAPRALPPGRLRPGDRRPAARARSTSRCGSASTRATVRGDVADAARVSAPAPRRRGLLPPRQLHLRPAGVPEPDRRRGDGRARRRAGCSAVAASSAGASRRRRARGRAARLGTASRSRGWTTTRAGPRTARIELEMEGGRMTRRRCAASTAAAAASRRTGRRRSPTRPACRRARLPDRHAPPGSCGACCCAAIARGTDGGRPAARRSSPPATPTTRRSRCSTRGRPSPTCSPSTRSGSPTRASCAPRPSAARCWSWPARSATSSSPASPRAPGSRSTSRTRAGAPPRPVRERVTRGPGRHARSRASRPAASLPQTFETSRGARRARRVGTTLRPRLIGARSPSTPTLRRSTSPARRSPVDRRATCVAASPRPTTVGLVADPPTRQARAARRHRGPSSTASASRSSSRRPRRRRLRAARGGPHMNGGGGGCARGRGERPADAARPRDVTEQILEQSWTDERPPRVHRGPGLGHRSTLTEHLAAPPPTGADSRRPRPASSRCAPRRRLRPQRRRVVVAAQASMRYGAHGKKRRRGEDGSRRTSVDWDDAARRLGHHRQPGHRPGVRRHPPRPDVAGSCATPARSPRRPRRSRFASPTRHALRADFALSAKATGLGLRTAGQRPRGRGPLELAALGVRGPRPPRRSEPAGPRRAARRRGGSRARRALTEPRPHGPHLRAGQPVALTGERADLRRRRRRARSSSSQSVTHDGGSHDALRSPRARHHATCAAPCALNANVVRGDARRDGRREMLGSGDGSGPTSGSRCASRRSPTSPAGTPSGAAQHARGPRRRRALGRGADALRAGPRRRGYVRAHRRRRRRPSSSSATATTAPGCRPASRTSPRPTAAASAPPGMVAAGAITLLTDPPARHRAASRTRSRPRAPRSPERSTSARANAPLTVLTLDRVVSLRDSEDFARGVRRHRQGARRRCSGAASARRVHLTVAGAPTRRERRSPRPADRSTHLAPGARRGAGPGALRGRASTPTAALLRPSAPTSLVDPRSMPGDVVAAVRAALVAAFSFDRARVRPGRDASAEVVAVVRRRRRASRRRRRAASAPTERRAAARPACSTAGPSPGAPASPSARRAGQLLLVNPPGRRHRARCRVSP